MNHIGPMKWWPPRFLDPEAIHGRNRQSMSMAVEVRAPCTERDLRPDVVERPRQLGGVSADPGGSGSTSSSGIDGDPHITSPSRL